MTQERPKRATSDDIAAAITQFCAQKGIKPGDRLPPERELAELLDLSRAELRRGLGRLESGHLIQRTVGRGTFLSDPSERASEVSPREVLEIRQILEPALMTLVVRNASPADIARVRQCLDESERAETQEQFEHWDGALHAAIIASTRNQMVTNIYDLIGDARNRDVWGNMKRASFTVERRAMYEAHHREIVEALANRDADVAARASSNHIRVITQNMLGTT